MDLSIFRKAHRRPAAGPAGFDYRMLTASLHACQAASATARAQARSDVAVGRGASSHAALVELLVAGPNWRDAVEELGGCFNSRQARHNVSEA